MLVDGLLPSWSIVITGAAFCFVKLKSPPSTVTSPEKVTLLFAMVIASEPPVVIPIVLEPGKYIPVLVVPNLAMLGADSDPPWNNVAPSNLYVISEPKKYNNLTEIKYASKIIYKNLLNNLLEN